MSLFIEKMAAVVMAIVSAIVLDSVLLGNYSLLGGLALLACCGYITLHLFYASAKKARRRKRAAAKRQLQLQSISRHPAA